MSEKNKNLIVNMPNDDDDFGGYVAPKNIIDKIYRKHAPAPVVDDSDDDLDEFGYRVIDKAALLNKIYRHAPAPVVDENEENENIEDSEESEEILIECKYPIFSPFLHTNQWLINRDEMRNTVTTKDGSITIPLVIDTEFTNKKSKEYQQNSRLGLTTQVKSIHKDDKGIILTHTPQVNAGREMAGLKPFPMIKSDFDVVDYLNYIGLDCEVFESVESDLSNLNKCFIVLYGHFLTAEINMICNGSVKEKIKNLQRETNEQLPNIDNGRRAFCKQTIDGYQLDWVSLKHIISINGYEYELCLKLVDTGAVHGVASYKDFCDSVGWKLQYKDNFTSDEKSDMLRMAIERPTHFAQYALGDLEVYEALENYHKQWQLVYEKLGLSEYYQTPKLTIGGTVKDLFESALAANLGIVNDDENDKTWQDLLTEIINEHIKPSSANDLRQFSTFTRALLSKVEGGRCRNNRPIDIFVKRKIKNGYDVNLICDIDISGCYGEGQRNQDYYIGNPEILDYKHSKNNEYITLREWLKQYNVNVNKLIETVKNKDLQQWQNSDNWGELMPGAWYARISTKSQLKYSQDYFASWFTESGYKTDVMAKFIKSMKSDTELTTTDWVNFNEETGNLKIFNNEIHNGVLTHDGLQWILAIASSRQRNELLDNIQILASSLYLKSEKIDCENSIDGLQKLRNINSKWSGKNTTNRIKIDGKSTIVMNFQECHSWFSINLGDLLINNLLIERKKAQKQYGKKSPLDTLFKLCVNTLYGDMVSKYFVSSNPVVGNNITARARALAWYMEKGLNGWQSITDGCAFELNNVLTSNRDKLDGETTNLHRKDSKLNRWKIKKSGLNNVEYLMIDNEIFINQNDNLTSIGKGSDNTYINTVAMNHLQNEFSLVDVLHKQTNAIKVNDDLSVKYQDRLGQFSFETKDTYWSGAFHGTANYILCNAQNTVIKARGYELKKPHQSIESELIDDCDEIRFYNERYGKENNPAKDFLNQLLENPENIERQNPAIKSAILKISDYKNLSCKYDYLGIEPGDNVLKAFLMQEFSITQFTFKNYEQYMNWKKIIEHLKDTDKQSLEGFFLNSDGTLNFINLALWVDEKINDGIDKPFDKLDKHRNKSRTSKRTENPVTDGKGKGKKQKNVSLSHPNLESFKAVKEKLNLAD